MKKIPWWTTLIAVAINLSIQYYLVYINKMITQWEWWMYPLSWHLGAIMVFCFLFTLLYWLDQWEMT